ncbi:hypothetical protein AB0C29_16730 [Actinoplanes sp. NPDC048791]|uniref:hypothetical protein n=1 Tax=Actinoplanes sp. NPDC048791 TaxID=3154623 RepID=UPI0033E77BE1
MKRIGVVLLWIIGLFFVARAVVEPFVIDLTDPATYHLDWGGPHLAGVLADQFSPAMVGAALWVRSHTRPRPPAVAVRQ